jgi:succinate-semialdehyde dehydrogenase/glutarate-semialdehyde dehydrogenase
VHESVYRAFEERFVEDMAAQRVGDPMQEDTQIGPLATSQIADDLQKQVDAAIGAGGRLLVGGRRFIRTGNFFAPTVIAGLPRDAAVAREETFGPLAFLFKVGSLDDAIALANDTPFGLGASCWTNEISEQQRLAIELQCGSVFFNAPVASDPRLPFGGIKKSGYGRELSAAGMREFLNAKTVVIAATAESLKATKTAADQKLVLPMREQPLVAVKSTGKAKKSKSGIATLGLTSSSE